MRNDKLQNRVIIGTERQLSKVSVDKIKVGQTKACVSAFITCTISGILGSICPVNLPKGLSMRSLLLGWLL